MAGPGMRARQHGMSHTSVALIALAVIAPLIYLGFTKDVPFVGDQFEVRAVFESSNSIRPNSPVRIAGVNVGKVSSVEPQPGGNGAVVRMAIKESGLPIHRDATAKIRPRIFLEGNFFVDLKPGSPSAPVLGDGDSIHVTQTATPVQLDQVLTTLQEDTRQDLRDTLDGLAVALSEKPAGGGRTGAEAFNAMLDDAAEAERATAVVNDSLLGTQKERDIGRLVRGASRAATGLVRNEAQLKQLITDLNTTTAALAAEGGNLRDSIRLLAPTLESANAAFASLNAAFPPTRVFAREVLPGVRETPETVRLSFPWMAETRRLLSRAELGGLVRDLSPAAADLARLTDQLRALFPQADLIAKCATKVVLPTGDVVIEDEFTTGSENYKEFLYAMVGLSSEGQNWDGNGSMVRFQPGGGSETISLGNVAGGADRLYGSAVAPPLGTRPVYPGKLPPYVTDQPCHEQKPPDLNGPAARKGGSDALRREKGGSNR